MNKKINKTPLMTETDRILLECLANIQKSIKAYQRDVADTLEEARFTILLTEED